MFLRDLGKFVKLVLSNNLGNFALDFLFYSDSDKSCEENCPVSDFLCMTEMGQGTVHKYTKLLKHVQSQKRNIKVQEFCFYFTVVVKQNSKCFNKCATEQSEQS